MCGGIVSILESHIGRQLVCNVLQTSLFFANLAPGMIDINALEFNIFFSLSPFIAEARLKFFLTPLFDRLYQSSLYHSMTSINSSRRQGKSLAYI